MKINLLFYLTQNYFDTVYLCENECHGVFLFAAAKAFRYVGAWQQKRWKCKAWFLFVTTPEKHLHHKWSWYSNKENVLKYLGLKPIYFTLTRDDKKNKKL